MRMLSQLEFVKKMVSLGTHIQFSVRPAPCAEHSVILPAVCAVLGLSELRSDELRGQRYDIR